ncbi:MAG: 4-hydroxy-tetrahydrodipicolinate synthase [bacterium]|jgi:4-hydroxy-tetrahydrodipicolinate synthase
MNAPFGKVVTAVITPFTEGGAEIDYVAVERLAAHLCPEHTDSVVVCGTTGEGPTITRTEKLALWEYWLGAAPEGIKIIANTGTNNTAESVELTQKAKRIGVHAAMAVMPYYNKPNFDGQIAHFTAVADCGLPVMLYNVPGRTGGKLLPEAACELSKHPNIVAIKEAAGDPLLVTYFKENATPGFAVYSGDDPLTYEMCKLGGAGVVSVASHLVGREIREMIDAVQSGDDAKAKAIHERLTPLFDAIFVTTNPIPIKTACAMLGLCDEEFRLPMTRMRDAERNALAELMGKFGLL